MESEIPSSGGTKGLTDITSPRRAEDPVGALGDTQVEQVKNQTSKAWFILAIAIGILVVGVGTFGGVGLLQSHGLISLPHWLASTIGTVGNTPHFWSLWAIAAGGALAGGGLIAFGSSKIHTIRKEEKRVVDELEAKKEWLEAQEKADMVELENNFGDYFAIQDVVIAKFEGLRPGTATYIQWGIHNHKDEASSFVPSLVPARYTVIFMNRTGQLRCTRMKVTSEERDKLMDLLQKRWGFTPV